MNESESKEKMRYNTCCYHFYVMTMKMMMNMKIRDVYDAGIVN